MQAQYILEEEDAFYIYHDRMCRGRMIREDGTVKDIFLDRDRKLVEKIKSQGEKLPYAISITLKSAKDYEGKARKRKPISVRKKRKRIKLTF